MPCYRPIPARQDKPGGKVFLHPAVGTATMQLPCGKCLGCRKRRAKEWAVRCMHEASLSPKNSFVTLTYDDEHLPSNGFLRPKDLGDFLKRLRNAIVRKQYEHIDADGLRYFACGEYGDSTFRAHYHALLFGVKFTDLYPIKRDLFTSETLKRIWGHGNVSIGTVTVRSAMYCAMYSVKKRSKYNWNVHDADGVVAPQPFMRCSLKPGIGSKWLQKFYNDMQHGYIVVDKGAKWAVPKYYQSVIKRADEEVHEEQRAAALKHFGQVRFTNLEVAEVIAEREQELMNPRKFNL